MNNSWFIYLLCVIPLLVQAVTAVVRANDIGWKRKGWPWIVRRFGMVLIGGSAAGFLLEPIWGFRQQWLDDACIVAIFWGWAMTWFTTPGLPPWWKYITHAASEPVTATLDAPALANRRATDAHPAESD